MSKVLFVVPVFKETLRQECRGTLLLATILKEKGIDVDILRFFEFAPQSDFNTFVDNAVTGILAKDPRIVSFYCRSDCYLANLMIAKKLKEIRPDIYIVFGGPQADITSKDTIRLIPWVDYCCSGEGETTVYPLFSGLLEGKDVTHIAGLTYRNENNEIITNPRPALIEDLDTLPSVDYSFLPKSIVAQISSNPPKFLIDVGRGCPYNCAYCSTSMFWQRKFRLKSAERIIDELKEIHEKFGITQFIFDHDLFTANKRRTLEFCRALKESKLNIQWSCSSRADTIDKETIEEMASAGLRSIYLGIETGSPRMQKITHKNLNLEKALENISYIADNNIKITASFIYGYPEETYDDLNRTLELIYTLSGYKNISIQTHLCSFLPGTEYFERYKDNMEWAENISDITGDFGVKENIDFIQAHKELFPFFYEYHSELRNRFNGMYDNIMLFMELYRLVNTYDPENAKSRRIIDAYLDFIDSNEKLLKGNIDSKNLPKHKVELFTNYATSVYNEESAQKFSEIIKFKNDIAKLNASENDAVDVKMYCIDTNAVLKEKTLNEIAERTTMVYISKANGEISCRTQYLN